MQLGELGGMLEIVYIDRRIPIFGILSILLSDINYPDPCSPAPISISSSSLQDNETCFIYMKYL